MDSRRSTLSTSDFLASDEEKGQENPIKKKKVQLKDILGSGGTPKKASATPKKDSSTPQKGSMLEGRVKTHDNADGPKCPKCPLICKDKNNLRNHVLSHYYQTFYAVLPSSKPFECPECDKPNRDRITLARHYAFTHFKMFEMTDITPDMLNCGGGDRKRATPAKPRTPSAGKSKESKSSPKKPKSIPVASGKVKSKETISSDSDSDGEIDRLLARANEKLNGVPSTFISKPKISSEKLHTENKEKEKKHKHDKERKHKDGKEKKSDEKERRRSSEKKHKEKHKKRDKSKEKHKKVKTKHL